MGPGLLTGVLDAATGELVAAGTAVGVDPPDDGVTAGVALRDCGAATVGVGAVKGDEGEEEEVGLVTVVLRDGAGVAACGSQIHKLTSETQDGKNPYQQRFMCACLCSLTVGPTNDGRNNDDSNTVCKKRRARCAMHVLSSPRGSGGGGAARVSL